MNHLVLAACCATLALAMATARSPIGQPAGEQDTHDGKVIGVSGNKLVMLDPDTSKEHTYLLAPGAQVTCDGKECKLADLKPGFKVRVTFRKVDRKVALQIEALDRHKEFEKKTGP